MLSELTFFGKIAGWFFSFFKIEYYSNRQKANVYVAEVLEHVKVVIKSKNLSEGEIAYSHEMVKKLYASVSESIGDLISSNDLAKVRQALAAARVYYWVRHYEGKPGEEITELIKDRIKRIRAGEVRHNSNEVIIKKIISLNPTTPRLVEHEIELIYANCLADIAELEELHLSVVKSRVRSW